MTYEERMKLEAFDISYTIEYYEAGKISKTEMLEMMEATIAYMEELTSQEQE